MLASASNKGVLKIWEIKGKSLVQMTEFTQKSNISSLSYNDDQGILYLGTTSGQLFFLKIRSVIGKPELLAGTGKAVTAVAVSHDGKYLAAGLTTGLIQIFNTENPAKDRVDLIGHISAVTSLDFNVNDNTLASCSYDKTIRLWNFREAATPPVVIEDNDKWVYGIAFSADQQKIVSCGADKTIRIFGINTVKLSGKICSIVKRNLSDIEWNKYIGEDIPYHKTCNNH